jgi:hypothetical protein
MELRIIIMCYYLFMIFTGGIILFLTLIETLFYEKNLNEIKHTGFLLSI